MSGWSCLGGNARSGQYILCTGFLSGKNLTLLVNCEKKNSQRASMTKCRRLAQEAMLLSMFLHIGSLIEISSCPASLACDLSQNRHES